MSFLDKTGLEHFWAQCLNKFATKDAIPSVEGLASESYVDNKVASMVDSAPETLNTLNELAAALGDDPNFATTVANQIGTIESEVDGKVSKSGDTITGNLNFTRSDGYGYVAFTDADGNISGYIRSTPDTHRIQLAHKATDTDYAEYFMPPAPSTGLTASKIYNILTSKNTVTIAQGGTGATTADGACTNLGAVKKSGDTMTGQLTALQLNASIGTSYTIMTASRDSKTTFLLQQDPSTSRIQLMQIHPNSTFAERYRLPYPNADATADMNYDILTTKSAVTIAQGGTGATTTEGALTNLGAFGALGNAADFGSDLNSFTQTGAILISSDVANRPPKTSIYGICWNVYGKVNSYLEQHYLNAATLKRYVRFKIDNVWRTWAQEYDSNFKPTPADIGAASDSHTHQNLVKTSSNYSGSLNAGFADQTSLIGWDISGKYSNDDDTVIALSLRINKENGNIQARTDSKAGTKYPTFYTTLNKPTAADVGALPLNPASIEMYAGASANHGGFIGFHYNGSTSDHTSRIIESASSVLDINNVSGGKVRLGTVTAGIWQGSTIGVAYGGTGATTAAAARTNLGITPANIGAVPTSLTVNGKALSSNISLTSTDINAKTIASNADPMSTLGRGLYISELPSTAAVSGDPTYAALFTAIHSSDRGFQISGGKVDKKLYWRYFDSNATSSGGVNNLSDWFTIYSSNNKPTAADVGAVALNGNSTVNGIITATKVIGAVYA